VSADCKVSTVRGGEKMALEEYVFNGLKGLSAWTGYLFQGVLQEESLCVFASEGVTCNKLVES
jgi:hypothetical protein